MNEKGDYTIRLGVDYMTTYIYDEEALLPFTKTHSSVHFERIIRTPDELEKGYIENQYDIVLSHMDVPYTTEIKNISHIPFGVLLANVIEPSSFTTKFSAFLGEVLFFISCDV